MPSWGKQAAWWCWRDGAPPHANVTLGRSLLQFGYYHVGGHGATESATHEAQPPVSSVLSATPKAVTALCVAQVGHGLGNNGASTGMLAVAMAVALGRRLGLRPPSVYGFGGCARCAKYYDCRGDSAGGEKLGANQGSHAFGEEAEVRRAWRAQGVIELVEEACE